MSEFPELDCEDERHVYPEGRPKKKHSVILDSIDWSEFMGEPEPPVIATVHNLDDLERIKALEADNARLRGLVGESFEALAHDCEYHKAENERLTRIIAHLTQTAADHCERWSRAEGRIRAIAEIVKGPGWGCSYDFLTKKWLEIQALAALDPTDTPTEQETSHEPQT